VGYGRDHGRGAARTLPTTSQPKVSLSTSVFRLDPQEDILWDANSATEMV
jgi:hypothetical protein